MCEVSWKSHLWAPCVSSRREKERVTGVKLIEALRLGCFVLCWAEGSESSERRKSTPRGRGKRQMDRIMIRGSDGRTLAQGSHRECV